MGGEIPALMIDQYIAGAFVVSPFFLFLLLAGFAIAGTMKDFG